VRARRSLRSTFRALIASLVRVLTLNCWHVSEPFAERMALIRAGIAALKPDLIGLQEIIVRRDGFDQGALIFHGLPYQHVFGCAFGWDDPSRLMSGEARHEAFGNLIASRWPIAAHERRELPGFEESGDRRCALAARIAAPFGEAVMLCTHLNWNRHEGAIRERQARAVADFAREWARGVTVPPIVVGDLNAEPDATEVRILTDAASGDGHTTHFQDAWRVAGTGPGYTWDNRNRFAAQSVEPDRRIDYVLVGLAERSRQGRVDRVALAFDQPTADVWPSDHFGVVADIRV
jgi:endonuclease/exonuclease/phosphatase family metal-dependent hydrolase